MTDRHINFRFRHNKNSESIKIFGDSISLIELK